jgi:hypothetical protein
MFFAERRSSIHALHIEHLELIKNRLKREDFKVIRRYEVQASSE